MNRSSSNHTGLFLFFVLWLTLSFCPQLTADEYIVLFPHKAVTDRTLSETQASEILVKHHEKCKADFEKSLSTVRETPRSVDYLFAINGAIVDCSEKTIRELSNSSSVETVCNPFPVFPPKTITEKADSSSNEAAYTEGVALVGAPQVWDEMGYTGKDVVIGHIDTGINADHDDIKGKVIAFKDFVVPSNTSPNDNGGHGTHTAGTIVGGNASGKHIGVAPNAKLIVAKAIGYGKSSSNLLKAMDWMCDPDGNKETKDSPVAVSCSWRSGGGDQTPFYRAVDTWVALGIFPCFSAGNSGPGSSTITPPKEYPLAFCSAAVDFNDQITSFSSRGPGIFGAVKTDKPDVAGPGNKVYSADRSGAYSIKSGTSMACPHTAGIIALMTEANPIMSVTDKMNVLKDTGVDLGNPGFDYTYGHGRINAPAAVEACLSGVIVRGTVTDQNQSPISAQVHAGNDIFVQSNDQGLFQLYLQKGAYSLTVSAFGYESVCKPLNILEGSGTVEVQVSLTKCEEFTVSGTVTSLVTNAPTKAKVIVKNSPVAFDTAQDGTYSALLPKGPHTFLVEAPGHKQMVFEEIINSDTTLNFDLEPVPPVLVVDDASYGDFLDYYDAALRKSNIDFNTVKRSKGQLPFKDLAIYDLVIWFTGNDRSSTLDYSDQSALTEYLESGGKLILFGENIAYTLRYRKFLRDIMKAKYLGDSSDINNLRGFSTFFDLQGGDSANNMQRPDRLNASSPTQTKVLVRYRSGEAAGIYTSSSAGDAMLFGFGLESVSNAQKRGLLMEESLRIIHPSEKEIVGRLLRLPSEMKAFYYHHRIEPHMSVESIKKVSEELGATHLIRALKIISNFSSMK